MFNAEIYARDPTVYSACSGKMDLDSECSAPGLEAELNLMFARKLDWTVNFSDPNAVGYNWSRADYDILSISWGFYEKECAELRCILPPASFGMPAAYVHPFPLTFVDVNFDVVRAPAKILWGAAGLLMTLLTLHRWLNTYFSRVDGTQDINHFATGSFIILLTRYQDVFLGLKRLRQTASKPVKISLLMWTFGQWYSLLRYKAAIMQQYNAAQFNPTDYSTVDALVNLGCTSNYTLVLATDWYSKTLSISSSLAWYAEEICPRVESCSKTTGDETEDWKRIVCSFGGGGRRLVVTHRSLLLPYIDRTPGTITFDYKPAKVQTHHTYRVPLTDGTPWWTGFKALRGFETFTTTVQNTWIQAIEFGLVDKLRKKYGEVSVEGPRKRKTSLNHGLPQYAKMVAICFAMWIAMSVLLVIEMSCDSMRYTVIW